MKNINKLIASALLGVAFVSCNDLDTEYVGYYVTSDQKDAVLEMNPEMAQAGVNTIASMFSRCGGILGEDNHSDFGYPGLMLGMDCMTADMNSRAVGYNHFQAWCAWSDINPTGTINFLVWCNEYNQIYTANSVLANITQEVAAGDDLLKVYRAQALGFRSFNYWVLAQMFQFNYQDNQQKPCVPIITEKNRDEVAEIGAARASVEEVYSMIMSDLTEAIELSEASKVSVLSLIASKPRRMLGLDALYGMRARVNLTMGKYAEAAADAKKAIAVSSTSPLSIAECSKPGFNSLSAHNWMWGVAIAETDRVVTSGIINFPSQICSFAYGYVTVGVFRGIASDLWDAIPAGDVRRGWWLDDNYNSPIINDAQLEYLLSYGKGNVDDAGQSLIAHTNVKFDSYNSVLRQNVNASDIPLMRIEEMYYIAAEGMAMSGQLAEATQFISDFEKAYRNPSFVCLATTPADFQEMIWNKRRVEFWGEGLAYFDLQRLKKNVNRLQAGCVPTWRYDITPNNPVRIMQIPENEMQTNPMLNQNDSPDSPSGNNQQGVRPTPIRG
ncbi:MAG: RagB/SusD family nutrient uptake outer membrane protein [Muribaculaceae bacterium]|nr:RagB/SusD family nutrient uptake outer membrane protein [Muribaculaceae bacterium]